MINWYSIAVSLVVGTLGSISVSTFVQPSQAQTTTFFCGTSGKGVPTTLARTPRGDVEVVRWVSTHFRDSGYSPQRRCEEVSKRFQSFHNRQMMDFITAGYVNGLPAVCVGNGNTPCSSDRLLFTLKPGQNAARTIQQLFNVRTLASGPLYESSGGSNRGSVVDMRKFLDEAPLAQPSVTNNLQAIPATPPEPTSTPSKGGNLW